MQTNKLAVLQINRAIIANELEQLTSLTRLRQSIGLLLDGHGMRIDEELGRFLADAEQVVTSEQVQRKLFDVSLIQ